MRHRPGLVILASLLLCSAAFAAWRPIIEDEFDRPMLGADWRVMRGDWRIEGGRLRITRAWPSDNSLVSTRPLPRGDVRALIGIVPDSGSMQLALRCGEHHWGGGGYPDDFSVTIQAQADAAEPIVAGNTISVAPNVEYLVEMLIEGARGRVLLDGKLLIERVLPPARSEVNRSFYINCMPNGWFTSVRLHTRPDAPLAIAVAANSDAENQRAVVHASATIDPANPALGIQQAIDSLPPNGGVVILPEGHYLQRRHLVLRSGVALRGQGWSRTTLEHAPIHETKVIEIEQDGDVCRVTVEDAAGFQVGDGMCFGRSWSHIADHSMKTPNRDMTLSAIDGNVLTVRGVAPADDGSHGARLARATIKNFFPLIYCVLAEFVEVSDMTLRGPASGPGGGGFNNCPVTFGNVYGARVQRLNVEDFPADGISIQRAGDALVTDNTVGNSGQGFHPGTFTQRFLWARNLSAAGNPAHAGLFFCFANENGVYHRGTVGRFTGYPFVGNNFNVISGNLSAGSLSISSSGYAGLIFNNRLPGIETSPADVEPGFPRYFSGPSYYVLGENRVDSIVFGAGSEAIVALGNIGPDGPAPVEGLTDAILHARELPGLAEKLGLDIGVGRDTPVDPPRRAAPVLDGREFLDPTRADAGFQVALDQLAGNGGTLQLPAGRHELRTALRIPANVTLAGYGVATVLFAHPDHDGSLLVAENATGIGIRDLSILGQYSMTESQAPAISLTATDGATIIGVDIRGWDGIGIHATAAMAQIRDCRVIGCGGVGYLLEGGVQVTTSLARECAAGIAVRDATAATRVEAIIASSNRGPGISVTGGADVLVASNNSHFNFGDGILLDGVRGGHVIGNLARGNNQQLDQGAGIRLTQVHGVTVAYNHCSDEQIHATQARGIVEEAGCDGNTIIGNLTAPFHQPYHHEAIPALTTHGKASVVAHNLTKSAFPTGSSIEWYAMGFEGTPHVYGRLAGQLRQQLEQATRQLERTRNQAEATAERIAPYEAALRDATLRQDHFNQARAVRQARLRVMTLEFEQATQAAIAAARAVVAEEERRLDELNKQLQKTAQ